MVFRFNIWFSLFREVKNAPEIPEVTNFLTKSKFFEKIAMKIHFMKLKAW